MWLPVSGILVLFLYANPTVSRDVCSDGMIKEAILSLARIIRDNSLRIERHEARDRQNSDYVRKAVDDLTKKVSVVDTFNTHFSKIGDQISEIEQLITQRDERERIQMQKTTDSIQNLESRLESRLDEIKNTISEVSRRPEPTQAAPTPESVSPSDIISKLNDTEVHLVVRIAQIQSSLDTLAIENRAAARKQDTADKKRNESERSQDERTETLILNLENRLKTRLDQMNNTMNEVNDRVAPSPVSASDIISKLNDTEADFLEKIEQIHSKLNTMDTKNTEEAARQARKLQNASTERNERARIQDERTETLILNLENRLKTQLDQMNNTMNELNDRVAPIPPCPTTESPSASDIMSKLNDTEVNFLEKVEEIHSKLNTMDTKITEEAATQARKLQNASTERNERERIQEERTETLILNLANRLETRLDAMNNTINEVNDRVEATPPPPTTESVSAADIIDKLNVTEVHFLGKVGQIQSKLDTMDIENKREGSTQAEKLQTVFTEVQNVSSRLSDIASLLGDIQGAAKLDTEAIIQAQSREIKNVSDLVSNTLNLTQNLPMISEMQRELQKTKFDLEMIIVERIQGIITNFNESNNEVEHSIIDLRSDLANNTQSVNDRLRDIAKESKSVKGVVIRISDELRDTKKKLDYAILRILSGVAESINKHNAENNKTLIDKFNETINNIIDNQSSAVANVSNGMKQESKELSSQMKPVYQQLAKNGIILDKIDRQNEAYVTGTTSTLDGMEFKVGDIKKRMTDMDGNLNYLLGKLSLVTQGFNRIKIGLGAALDEVKASFKEIQEKADVLNHSGRQAESISGIISPN